VRTLKAKLVVCKYYLTITDEGFLRWVAVPQNDNEWNTSREHCLIQARRTWGRMIANTEAGRYDWFDPRDHGYDPPNLPEPAWPTETPARLFLLAFKERGRLIDSPDHPFVRKLVGRNGVGR
jgi:hypothetical protein